MGSIWTDIDEQKIKRDDRGGTEWILMAGKEIILFSTEIE